MGHVKEINVTEGKSKKKSIDFWFNKSKLLYRPTSIEMALLAMFQEIWSKLKVPSSNRQQFSKHGTGHFSMWN